MTRGITIRAGGAMLAGFASLSVFRSLDEAVSTATIGLAPSQIASQSVRRGMSIEIEYDGERLLTGFASGINASSQPDAVTATVSVRSRTCDLVDCSVIGPLVFRQRREIEIVRALCEPYGVGVVRGPGGDDVLPRFRVEPGETVFSAVTRLAQDRRFLVTDTEWGDLFLTRRSETTFPEISERTGYESADLSLSEEDTYSEIAIRGQAYGDDLSWQGAASIRGTEEDSTSRLRRLTIIPERSLRATADAQRRAQWEMATRQAMAASVTVTIPRWDIGDGTVWRPNGTARVTIPDLGIDGDLLVTDVELVATPDARRAVLTLRDATAYDPEPTIDRQRVRRTPKTAPLDRWIEGRV